MTLKYAKGTLSSANTLGKMFGNGDILVAQFTTPAAGSFGVGGNGGNISVIHYPGPNATRTVALSTSPCDFTPAGKNVAIGDSPAIGFSTTPAYGIALQPNTTYFFNVTNATSQGAGSCGSVDGNCPVLVTLSGR